MSKYQQMVLGMIQERYDSMDSMDGNDIIQLQREIIECRKVLEFMEEVFIHFEV
jgi:hypothetical protein